METPSTISVHSVVTIMIIIIVSKALTLTFCKKQSLKFTICSKSLNDETSSQRLVLWVLGLQ